MFAKIFKKSEKKSKKQDTASEAQESSSTEVSPRKSRPPYEKKARTLSHPFEEYQKVLYREAGTKMDRVTPGRKPQEVCVWFNVKTFVISYFAGPTRGKLGTQIGSGLHMFQVSTITSQIETISMFAMCMYSVLIAQLMLPRSRRCVGGR